jgi:hypothetical protein
MKIIFAAILGGIIVFAWGAVSWMVLRWHDPTLKVFANEELVAQTLTENAPVSGIYVLPKPQVPQSITHPASTDAVNAEAGAKMSEGPSAFVALTREGKDPQMKKEFAYAVALDIFAALLIALLVKATELGYLRRVLFIATVGIVVAVAGRLPYWIWWHFATDYMIVDCADVVVSWLLAGIVMAPLLGQESHRLGSGYRRVRM